MASGSAESVRSAVEGLGVSLASATPECDLDLVFRATLVVFIRTLVLTLGTSAKRFRTALPASDGWDAWQRSFQAADVELGYPGLFSPGGFPREHALLQRLELPPVALSRLRAACEAATTASQSPYDALAGVYQTLLRYRPEYEPTTGSFRLARSREGRRADGVFYTPRFIARRVVDAALTSQSAPYPRVFDPAMGAGIFLVEAARWHALLGRSATRIAEENLFGADRDPLAVELAILSLWLETGARPSTLAEHLQRANPLEGGGPPGSFDAVVGNPPWGVRIGEADSFKLFVEHAGRRARGAVGVVVPRAMLAQTSHADVRACLLSRFDPYVAIQLGDRCFQGAAAPACALIFGPKPGPREVAVADLRQGDACRPVWHPSPRTLWTVDRFPLEDYPILELLHRLRQTHPTLGQLRSFYRVHDTGINYNRASVARRALYDAPEPDDPRDLPSYRGRDFGRYTPIRRGGWLRHDVATTLEPGERFSLGRRVRQLPEKIVVRQTADRIVATVDSSRMAMGRSVIAITAEASASLPALLACLNSRLLTVLYRALSGEAGKLMAQVKVAKLYELPVPLAFQEGGLSTRESITSDTGDSAGWSLLHHLALDLLAVNGGDRELDEAIDDAVYTLYGLSTEEIALVAQSR